MDNDAIGRDLEDVGVPLRVITTFAAVHVNESTTGPLSIALNNHLISQRPILRRQLKRNINQSANHFQVTLDSNRRIHVPQAVSITMTELIQKLLSIAKTALLAENLPESLE